MPVPFALEIYHLIIQQVKEKRELCSLALCCASFRDEAQRFLFRRMDRKPLTRQKLFISAINSTPLRLGPFVKNLYIDEDGWNDKDSAVSLSMALRAMPNLQCLALRWAEPSTILRGCKFTLRTFVSKDKLERNEAFFLLLDFLPAQNRLKHLEISCRARIDAADVPPNLCPQLEFLGVDDTHLLNIFLRKGNRLGPNPQKYEGLQQIDSFDFKCLRYTSGSGLPTLFAQRLSCLIYIDLWVIAGGYDNLQEKVGFCCYYFRIDADTNTMGIL